MKSFILICGLFGFGIAQALLAEEHWESYKVKYGKNYKDYSEELFRKKVFKDNADLIEKHNLRYDAREETYKMGINEFTDMSDKEFEYRMLSGLVFTNSTKDIDHVYSPQANVKIPSSVDWRSSGGVTPVKNQLLCGSCWSFASTAVLETLQFRQTHRLVSLSEQNLLDCSSGAPYNNHGCHGGLPLLALAYVRDNGGVDTESSYPYEHVQSACRFKRNTIGARIRGVAQTQRNSEPALAAAVANFGPVAVGIDARTIKHYQSGVYSDPRCRNQPNHAVAVVGYGHDQRGGDYWIIKNSWGLGWGNQGYMKMARNRNNLCQIASFAVYPY